MKSTEAGLINPHMFLTDADRLTVAASFAADIEEETPGIPAPLWAEEINRRTGVGMDASRLVVWDYFENQEV